MVSIKIICTVCVVTNMFVKDQQAEQHKGKGVPSSRSEGWVPGGDPGPEPSPP